MCFIQRGLNQAKHVHAHAHTLTHTRLHKHTLPQNAQTCDRDSVNQGISAAAKIVFRNCDEAIKYVNTDKVNRAYTNVVDWDGSISGVSGGAILGSNSSFWKIGSDCVYRSEWRSWVCPKTPVVCQSIHASNITKAHTRMHAHARTHSSTRIHKIHKIAHTLIYPHHPRSRTQLH